MFTLAFAFATALAASSFGPVVHVENEIGTRVFVDRVDGGGEHVVCRAPCNAPLSKSGTPIV